MDEYKGQTAFEALAVKGEEDVVIFFREEGWYPVELCGTDVLRHVELNPGTLRVEDMHGKILWQPS